MKICPICHYRKMQGRHVCRPDRADAPVDPLEALTSYPDGMTLKQELAGLRAEFASLIYSISEPAP